MGALAMKSPLKFYCFRVEVAGQVVETLETPRPITEQEVEQLVQVMRNSYAALTDDYHIEVIEL